MGKRRESSSMLKLLARLAIRGHDQTCGERLLAVQAVPIGHCSVCTRGWRDKGSRKGRHFCSQGKRGNTSPVFEKPPVNLLFSRIDENLFQVLFLRAKAVRENAQTTA